MPRPTCRPYDTEASSRLRRVSFALLRERIRHTRRRLDTVSKELFHLHHLLASSHATWLGYEGEWTTAQASATTKQKRKFEHLHGTQHPVDTDRVVVNLSDKVLDAAAIAVLSKDLNFAETTIRSHTKDFISGVNTLSDIFQQRQQKKYDRRPVES